MHQTAHGYTSGPKSYDIIDVSPQYAMADTENIWSKTQAERAPRVEVHLGVPPVLKPAGNAHDISKEAKEDGA